MTDFYYYNGQSTYKSYKETFIAKGGVRIFSQKEIYIKFATRNRSKPCKLKRD